MKIVFLDFDGVLNSLSDIAFGHPAAIFKRDAIARLNDILHLSKAKVVISSSWRVHHSLDELRGFLEELGFQGEIIAATPVFSHQHAQGLKDLGLIRCQEIQAWIDAQLEPLTSFVILDDMELQLLAAYHVQTDMEIGLCDEHVGQAVAILG